MTDETPLKLSEAKFDDKYRPLIAAYNALAPLDRAVLHILSLIYVPVARTHILNSLKNLFAGKTEIKIYTVKSLDPILKGLVRSGLAHGSGTSFGCAFFLREPLCRMLVERGRFEDVATAVQRALRMNGPLDIRLFPSDEELMSRIRIGLYRRNVDDVQRLLTYYEKQIAPYHSYRYETVHPFVIFFKESFDAAWASEFLPGELQSAIAIAFANYFQGRFEPIDREIMAFLAQRITAVPRPEEDSGDPVRTFLAERTLLDGRYHEAEKLFQDTEGFPVFLIRGASCFFEGKNAEAISHYETALKLLKRTTRKRKIYFDRLPGLFHILALLKSGSPRYVEDARQYTALAMSSSHNRLQTAYRTLNRFIAAREGDPDALEAIWEWPLVYSIADPFCALIEALVFYWLDRRKARRLLKRLKPLQEVANECGVEWLAAQYAALISRLSGKEAAGCERAAEFFETTGIHSLVDLIQPESQWEQALNALIRLKRPNSAAAETGKSSRLVWLLHAGDEYMPWHLAPREQVLNARGVWSKGRAIALKRLYHELDTFDFLTPQDRNICACLEEKARIWRGYPEISYHFNSKAMLALAGHPLVFLESSLEAPIEIVAGHPELLVCSQGNGQFEIAFPHAVDVGHEVQVIRETPTRIKVVETNEDIARIAKVIGKGLKVPTSGKARLLEAVASISPMVTVHSEIEDIGAGAEERPADPTPHIHLRPFGLGLRLDLRVQPFAPEGPCFLPGEGGVTVVSEIGGRLLRTKRDLNRERHLSETAAAACPTLQTFGEPDELKWGWVLGQPETCLEVLTELNALAPSSALIEWPEGESFRIRQQVGMNRFFLRIQKKKDWFSVSGELKLDDGLVLSMDRLLSLLEESTGRFVRLKDGEFLALTREFRKRLDDMAAYSRESGEERRFHPLAALSLEDLSGQLGGFRSDKHWKAHLKCVTEARSLTPKVPSTFKAELRDYQVEGFRWLARLSAWGVGACLADDMGLGKTVQALAVMLTRAAKGPCLVVAPTSVCMNWERETGRFAPSLNIVTLGATDREETLEGLKAFDLLLVTYGLLQQEKVARMIARVHFTTIVLDEAQAIKNLTTKRSQAAMDLDGDFRLITTGTPIENHLGELWNLFRFINPGLLGSLKEFTETFADPIEAKRDRSARSRLRRLVQPFILRRTKNQVMEELPPRTDILLQVDLSPEEFAFYEALRRKALENLDTGRVAGKGLHLAILAEIMKLRRACCNTKLVASDIALPSAKLAVFGDIVGELLENGHKALVFSQFTGHLDIIRQYVKERAIAYQYLDGATPAKERKKRVDAFQDGDGDLFLISLKAGGLGLNLTAADYVIHMDPWWNPAVEDQASDRAHRIGQTRPVTVYNLVARHTIEEKIVALHRTKRDLADSLLDGADMSGKMTADELLRLIREG
jgi:superfamily II DNA or RNA helicase